MLLFLISTQVGNVLPIVANFRQRGKYITEYKKKGCIMLYGSYLQAVEDGEFEFATSFNIKKRRNIRSSFKRRSS